jgi:hypothetical protein
MLPVIIFGGILGGVFSPTEAAAVAVLYAFLIATFVYREMSLKLLYRLLADTAAITGAIGLILGAAAAFSAILSFGGIPEEVAGVITVSSRTTGPAARVYFLSATAGLDAALGTFDGQAMSVGTYPDAITMQVTAPNEITFGAGGMAGPLVYNADTGKLTVPGIIDPTGLVFYEVTPGTVTTGEGLGGLYVSSEDKALHFVDAEGNDTTVGSAGGDGASSIVRNKYTATPKNVNDRQQILVYDSFTLDPEGTVVLREGGELVMLGGTASGGSGSTSAATDRYSAGFTYIGPRQQILSYEDYTIDLGATTEVAVSGYLVIL